MINMKSLLMFFYLFNMFNFYKLEEDEYYIQLYPSKNKAQSHLFHFYNLKSVFYTFNSTEDDNIKLIKQIVKNDELPIKKISSVISYKDFIIKTCFGPNKILEIIDENEEILTPSDTYFNSVKNNLENIEYCYSTSIANPYIPSEFIIITYWTEKTEVNRKEEYVHRTIIFYPKTKTFSTIYKLDTRGNVFFAQDCTNLRNKYIYCNIDNSFSLSKNHHFSIIPSFLNANNIDMLIRLVNVFARFSIANYHRPIGIYKYLYTKNGKYADYFLTEMHDKQKNKTKLITSYYYNYDSYSFISQVEGHEIYNGLNIEDMYIDPNLFNYILPNNQELIIIYLMKGAEGKNLLLLNRYNYTKDLKKKTKFDKYSSSNYLRDDICEKPKYIQSMYINSFIKYDDKDQEYIRENSNSSFYIYQKDIVTVLSCDDGNDKAFYQAKKIQMPQCLNVLDAINGFKTSLVFTKDVETIYFEFNKNPNYKSLRNVQIEFFDSLLYKNYLMVIHVKNGERKLVEKAEIIDSSQYERLEFSRTMFFKEGKTYQLPYRIIKTENSDKSNSCHLASDICYFEFYYKGEEKPECPYCENVANNTCEKCRDIIGLIKVDKECGCHCNEKKGFNKEPRIDIEMCVCKDGYSFYKDISQCLPNTVLNNGSFCFKYEVEKALINLYDDLLDGDSICPENGLPKCCNRSSLPPIPPICKPNVWFKLGSDIFYSHKIGKCVYITFNKRIVMYSKKSDCEYIDTDEFNDCLGINLDNEEDYYKALDNAYEYNLEDNNRSLIIETNKATFYLLNNYTEKNSTVHLSQACKEKVKEGYNLQNLLIFIATIKKPGYISTQVEYSFYNSTPEFINEKLNISLYCSKPKNKENNLNKRGLEVSEIWKNKGNYTTEIDKIIIYVEIDWRSQQMKNIKELKDKNIFIFDSDDPFYNDVCFNYTTQEETDIYLQDRRERYYIRDPLCESGCEQVGYDAQTFRIICECNIKGSTEEFENVTFIPNPLTKFFEKEYRGPNIFVLKCFGKLKLNLGLIISLILLIVFILISCLNFRKKEISSIFRNSKENRKIFNWEEPIEELKNKIQEFEDEFKSHNLDNGDRDGGSQGVVNQSDDPEVTLFRPVGNKDKNIDKNIDKNKENERNIKNDSTKKKLKLIDQSERSSQEIDNKTITNPTENSENNSETNIKKISDIKKIFVEQNKKKSKQEGKEEEEEKEEEEKKEKEEEEKEEKEKEEAKRKKEEEKEFEKMFEGYSDKQSEQSSKSGGTKTLPLMDNSYSKDSNYSSFPQNFNKEEEKHKKKSKSKKKEHKANPPSRAYPSIAPPGSKEEMIPNNQTNRRNETNNSSQLQCITSYEDCIYSAIKYPERFNIYSRWIAKIVSDNTLLFSLPLKGDKNGYFIKCSVLVLYISFYISVNIFFQFNSDTLHLFVQSNGKMGASIPGWILNILPNLFVYFLIHFFKDSLSLREFYLHEKKRIEHIKEIKEKYLTLEKYETSWEMKKKNEITRIKKFRNNLENNIRLSILFGLIILFIDGYYISVFFSVYQNSFWCVIVNVLMSILMHIGFFAIVHLVSSFSNINLAKGLSRMSMCCCGAFYFLFLSWKLCNEEFQKSEEHDEIDIEIEKQFGLNSRNNDEDQQSRNNNRPSGNNIITNQIKKMKYIIYK